MSFQAYLDTIKQKTGLDADDIRRIAAEKGLAKHADISAWAKGELGLGHGHTQAIAALLLKSEAMAAPLDEKVAKHFTGKKAPWRAAYDGLEARVKAFGDDAGISPVASYINLTRAGRKFGIVAVGVDRMDVGIKLKGFDPGVRLEAAGTWNDMVTHRVRVGEGNQVDDELLGWLRAAYDAAG